MKMMSLNDTNKRGRDPHYFICRISYLIIGIFIIHCPHPVFSATPIDSVAQVALSRVQIESLINRAGTTVKYGDVLIARGELSNEDVAIYYVDKNRLGNSFVKEYKINERGFFDEAWPEGFFDNISNSLMELWKSR